MKILTVPHPILSQKAQPVKKIDRKIRRIISEMKKTLKASKIGVGLAAPQIGIPLQIFLVSYKSSNSQKSHKTYKSLAFINPQLSNKSSPNGGTTSVKGRQKRKKRRYDLRKRRAFEGCLSIPNVWGYVKRVKEIRLKYLNEKGKPYQKTFKGFLATIIQHEVDHLEGILFTEHVLFQGEKLYRSKRDKKTGKAVMKEIKL